MIDAHNHLHDSRFDGRRAEIIAHLREKQVKVWGVNGTSEKDWSSVAELARNCTEVLPSFGLHPWRVKDRTVEWSTILEGQIKEGVEQGRRPGIGEIGLDKWIRDADLNDQELVFRQQLELAAAYKLPVTIHCLQCWGRMLQVLRDSPLPPGGFLLHSYSGPRELVDDFLELGAYFSFSGYFLHPRKVGVREIFQDSIPLERTLLETDAPDMMLPSERDPFLLSEVNHPGNIEVIYMAAAELWDMPCKTLEDQISRNFSALFGDTL